MTTLAATRAGAEHARQHLVMLHGIYGRGRNWHGIARAVISQRPEYACWLVDLPHHGHSGPGTHGDTVVGLAADLRDWLAAKRITPSAILGHSYGGKVALAVADLWREHPLQVWVIDSTPEVKEPSGSAWGMLSLVRRLPSRFATREQAVAAIMSGGYSAAVAQWMATNLARAHDGFTWRIDLDAMERLLRNFFTTDLWHVVEHPAPHELLFVKASESSAISPQAVQRLEAAPGAVRLHHRRGGHWLHAESPHVVTELLVDHLPINAEA